MHKFFYKIAAVFYKLYLFFSRKAKNIEKQYLPLSEINKEKWFADNREKELRYEYDLDERSVVIDVGGYEGDFASEMYSRYKSTVYVFEPVKRYVDYLTRRFRKNNSIVIIPKGLGAKNEELTINVMEEASSYNRTQSIHKKGTEERILIIDADSFFKENKIIFIDLIKINIEGAEYDLMDRIIELGYLTKCKNIQIQFHDFYPDFQNRYNRIKTELEKTHLLTYSYPFVWENWQLK
ncbi:MAG: FkbM family methyltransferase [Bacteroidetes bacterium]|nr:FkbM family methyltransferase [Bacteroidota bacterium]